MTPQKPLGTGFPRAGGDLLGGHECEPPAAGTCVHPPGRGDMGGFYYLCFHDSQATKEKASPVCLQRFLQVKVSFDPF